MNETLSVIKSRRSVRSFSSAPVSGDELTQIVEAGQYAPSAMNEQPWHFTVITNQDAIKRLNRACVDSLMQFGNEAIKNRFSGKDPDSVDLFYHAPVVIVVSGDANAIAPKIDGALAIENMFLAAESLQIGSCWIHALNHVFAAAEGKNMLVEEGIVPSQNVIVGTAVFGYKAEPNKDALPRTANTVQYID